MTGADLSISFSLGVLSSLHCAQMCGPIVLSYSIGSRPSMAGHLLYNAGRILTYGLLGAIAGGAGFAVNLVGTERTAAISFGVLMVLAAMVMSGSVPRQVLVQVNRSGISSRYSRTVGRLLQAPSARSKLALGLALGLLPCGLIYAALLKAAATGSATAGAASMMSFGIGTSGTLLAIGLFSSRIRFRLGAWSRQLAPLSVAAMGLVLVWRGWVSGAHGMAHHAGM
jgi:uncharacterized protein